MSSAEGPFSKNSLYISPKSSGVFAFKSAKH